jgi:maltooligosyltrehalose trehalohydrolase
MLAWVKELIRLRHSTVSLNDGDLGHLKIECHKENKSFVMERGKLRILANLGENPVTIDLLDGETLRLSSRDGVVLSEGQVAMPKMSFAVLDVPDSV